MKKEGNLIGFILCMMLLVVASGCFDKGSNEKVNQIVQHLQAGELDTALEKCSMLDDITLEKGREVILEVIIDKLEDILVKKWILTKYELVDVDTIEELKKYREILSCLKIENIFTNADEFVDTALQMEKFTVWNEYYKADDDYLEDVNYYLELAKKSSYWSSAVIYLEEAYDILSDACRNFANKTGKGMKVAYEYYKAFSVILKDTINGNDSSYSDELAYDRAASNYKKMLEEYVSVLKKMESIEKSFPSELY